ncbi:MAG: heparinase II/III domain-containing protein [Sulfuricaulis sp.]
MEKLISFSLFILFILNSTQTFALSVGGYPVYPNHPRIWFLADETGLQKTDRLLSVAEVRQLAYGQNSIYFHRLNVKYGDNKNYARSARVMAFRYVITGSDNDAEDAYESLMKVETNFSEYEAVDVVVPSACAYDWIYNWLAKPGNEALFSSATEKLRSIGRFVTNLGDHGPFSNITSSAYRGGGLLHVGIALGDQEMIDMAYSYYRDQMLKTANLVGSDGGWGEGLAYMNEIYSKNMILGGELLYTATAGRLNLFTDTNPFFAEYIPFTLFTIRPDFTYPHWGDIEHFSPQYNRDLRANLLPLTFRFHSGLGQYLLSKLDDSYGLQSVYEVLWKRDSPAAVDPESMHTDTRKRSTLFRGLGLAVMRTGFAPDDTYVSFKASHWLSSHVHADAGHFEIFKNGPLAIDSGSYDEWGSTHMHNYYARTIAHNTLTIFDPNEPLSDFSGYVNDGGQLYWDHNVFSTYQEGVKGTAPGGPFHAADILSYSRHNDFTYISADLTGAYSNKALNVGRQFFYFPNAKDALIVIIDRVFLKDRQFTVSFLLHFDGELSFSQNDFSVSNGKSTLYGKVVLPAVAVLIRRGAYEVNGYNYPPKVELPESGRGRLEVRSPRQASNSVWFVTLLSVEHLVPRVILSKSEETVSLKFTYAGVPIRISTDSVPHPSATKIMINGKEISLDTGILGGSQKNSEYSKKSDFP